MTDTERMDWLESQKAFDSHWTLERNAVRKEVWISSGNWSSDKAKRKWTLRQKIDEAIERSKAAK